MPENIIQTADTKSVVAVVATETQRDNERRRLTRIKRAIRRKTGGGVSELKVELDCNSLVLRGRCSSFYHKQVAQHAAMTLLDGESLVNEIEVASKPR
jgi:osmotically-inducible protein OsmY